MKNTISVFFLLFCIIVSAQNFELSTLRIGEYKIFQKKAEAEKLANTKFQKFDDYENKTTINYFGEKIEIVGYSTYLSEAEPNEIAVQFLSTKSKKFRTKSGMGVGSSKADLLAAYKDYPNFSVRQSWDDDGKSKTESYFSLSDTDARTDLSFKLINNVVVEVTVFVNEGC